MKGGKIGRGPASRARKERKANVWAERFQFRKIIYQGLQLSRIQQAAEKKSRVNVLPTGTGMLERRGYYQKKGKKGSRKCKHIPALAGRSRPRTNDQTAGNAEGEQKKANKSPSSTKKDGL